LLSAKHTIDIVFVALVIAAIVITAIVVARVLTDTFSTKLQSQNDDDADLQQQAMPESLREQKTMEDGGIALTITDPDLNDDPAAGDSGFEYSVTDEQLVVAQPDVAAAIYDSSPVILPITWGAVAGTLVWRGKVRSAWSRQGYDYDIFKLVTKMRGSPTRIRLLNAVSGTPKNKLQLAKELDVDWKTVDNHVAMLTQSRLVEEKQVVGTAKFYMITESGTKILSLLSSDDDKDSGSSIKN
jgi:hypothetical protein